MTLTKYAELRRGKVRWYYVVRSRNGRVLNTSQKYWSKSNARRAALRAGYAFHEGDLSGLKDGR